MSSLPNVRSLFGELLHLNGEDLQLPLEVLINLHRTQLRAPLLQAAKLGEASVVPGVQHLSVSGVPLGPLELAMLQLRRHVRECYPDLGYGQRYRDSDLLVGLWMHDPISTEGLHTALEATLEPGQELVSKLVRAAARDWYSYDPLMQLYGCTLPAAGPGMRLRMLEAELALSPQVGQLVLDMAALAVVA